MCLETNIYIEHYYFTKINFYFNCLSDKIKNNKKTTQNKI